VQSSAPQSVDCRVKLYICQRSERTQTDSVHVRVLDLFIPKWRRYVCPLIIAPVRAALALAIGGKIATRTTVLVLLSHYRSGELAGSTRRALYYS
jgi:hypothetical protein